MEPFHRQRQQKRETETGAERQADKQRETDRETETDRTDRNGRGGGERQRKKRSISQVSRHQYFSYSHGALMRSQIPMSNSVSHDKHHFSTERRSMIEVIGSARAGAEIGHNAANYIKALFA